MRLGRIVIALVVLGALGALGAYWIGPGVVPRARLNLLALDAESRFVEDARLAPADSTGRQPLILAVSNSGERDTGVQSITLAAPGWVRLYRAGGPVSPAEDESDELLRQYEFSLGGQPIEPGALPQVPAGLDRMWIAGEVPPITCRLRWDGVPELVPAPPWDAESLATVSVFYSIEGTRSRHTGVLVLRLDPASMPVQATFRAGDTVILTPGSAPPETDTLTLHGERSLTCGAPEQRVHLETSVWRTGPGRAGRLIVIRHDGTPRRLLWDSDGDGQIEREAWDGDADGLFEASRSVVFRTPAYLLPTDTAVAAPPDPIRVQPRDSTARRQPPDTGRVPQPDSGRSVPPDTAGALRVEER